MEKIRGKNLKEWKEYCKSDNVPIKTMKYITCLEERIKQLTLTDVSQQRELLIAFSGCVVKDVTRKGHEEVVDYFLKKHKGINCG